MNSTKKIHAGKAIGSGGFGCVFRPAIKCQGKKNKTKGISKLSKNNESKKEYKIIKNIQPIIKKIKNNEKYFLINEITFCQPAKLSISDFENANTCSIIEENSLSTFNKNIKNYKILNMPDGGVSLNYAIENNIIQFNIINKLLINILKNAIIPMNNLNLYHNDLKSENILYKNQNIKIIDFGEYFEYTNKIPEILKNRKILYNSPFSRILFNNFFINNFNNLIKNINLNNYSNEKLYNLIFKIVFKLYSHFVEKYNGIGHEQFLGEFVFKKLLEINPNNYFDFLPKIMKNDSKICLKIFIIMYCTEIFYNFLNKSTNKFDIQKYYNTVFIKNLDIYGFITCYVDYLFYKNSKIPFKISSLLIEFCFSKKFAAKPIDRNLLFQKLNSL